MCPKWPSVIKLLLKHSLLSQCLCMGGKRDAKMLSGRFSLPFFLSWLVKVEQARLISTVLTKCSRMSEGIKGYNVNLN